jgi:hypothetical protein
MPTEWKRVLEEMPKDMLLPLPPGYVLLDARKDPPLRAWVAHLEFRHELPRRGHAFGSSLDGACTVGSSSAINCTIPSTSAHPAKAGVAQLRVLASSATPASDGQLLTPRRFSRPPSYRSGARVCF